MLGSSPLSQDEIRNLSNALCGARSSGQSLAAYPDRLPTTLEEAYAVQDLSIAAFNDEVVGWKVGVVPPELREQVGAERLMGPVFKGAYHFVGKAHDDSEKIEMPAFEKGFIAVEAELIIEVAEDLEPGEVNTDGGVERFVKNVYAGIEIASSPVPNLNDYGPAAIISDFGNNNGMIVGAPIDQWQSKISQMETKVYINNELINTAPTDGILNGPMAAFAYIIDQAAVRGITLPAGCMICSGAITGVHETVVGVASTADFGGAGKINVGLVAM